MLRTLPGCLPQTLWARSEIDGWAGK